MLFFDREATAFRKCAEGTVLKRLHVGSFPDAPAHFFPEIPHNSKQKGISGNQKQCVAAGLQDTQCFAQDLFGMVDVLECFETGDRIECARWKGECMAIRDLEGEPRFLVPESPCPRDRFLSYINADDRRCVGAIQQHLCEDAVGAADVQQLASRGLDEFADFTESRGMPKTLKRIYTNGFFVPVGRHSFVELGGGNRVGQRALVLHRTAQKPFAKSGVNGFA